MLVKLKCTVPHEEDSFEAHSLLRDEPAVGTFRSDERHAFLDSLPYALMATAPMKRLANIGFLGALDFVRHSSGRSPHRRRHNRLEHSVGVAHLAETYARAIGLPESDRLLIVAAALLHDVGHGPLSHTLEPIFDLEFGINHHKVTRHIIEGETTWGSEIRAILTQHRIDVDRVLSLIEGEGGSDALGILFSGQINIDTLEGITRCRAFAGRRHAYIPANSVVQKWATNSEMPLEEFDAFWELKGAVYNLFIGAPKSAALDALAQAYMRSNRKSFARDDYLLSEREFRRRHKYLFYLLDRASHNFREIIREVPQDWLMQEVSVKQRSFVVCREIPLEGNASINSRYQQSKSLITRKLIELFGVA